MTLTDTQLQEILHVLAGTCDPATLQTIENTLRPYSHATQNYPSEPYSVIKTNSQQLHQHLRTTGRGIVANNPNDEVLAIFMEREQVSRILDAVPAYGHLAALPGIEYKPDGTKQITISLLAADRKCRILQEHIDGSLNGEESWGQRSVMGDIANVLR